MARFSSPYSFSLSSALSLWLMRPCSVAQVRQGCPLLLYMKLLILTVTRLPWICHRDLTLRLRREVTAPPFANRLFLLDLLSNWRLGDTRTSMIPPAVLYAASVTELGAPFGASSEPKRGVH